MSADLGTPEMRAFLLELADLMEHHGVTSLEVTEFKQDFEGIDVEIAGWDADDERTHGGYCSVNIGCFVDADALRRLVDKDEGS